LRGDAAEHDARFVAELAEQLGLAFARVDLDSGAAQGNVEAWARQERYRALAKMAHEYGAGYIVTAHHADDQLETLLLRMLRGTGVRGLRGIAWERSFRFQVSGFKLETAAEPSAPGSLKLIRPMLSVTRAEVLAFLREIGQRRCEDHTNVDVTRDRARLRTDVLPVLREVRGDAARKAVRLADHAREADRLVRREVARAYAQLVREEAGALVLERAGARTLPRVVLTGLLRRLLCEAGVPRGRVTRRVVVPVVRAVRDRRGGERRFDLAGGAQVTIDGGRVTIDRAV
ncbi:MAG: tRNA lysidine(34) synthetase TilS, partial [Phycisphaeraceae bacterium]